jgi:uncharacterized protein (TIGR00290 family)
MHRVLVAWSSGKDSAWMLSRLQRDATLEVAALMTTFDERRAEVSMHGIPRTLVAAQAEAAGLPLWSVSLPWPSPDAIYAAHMRETVARACAEDITAVAFGDLFLADIRAWRERQLADSGLVPLFPLWRSESNTTTLAREMVDGGLRAVTCAVDTSRLDAGYAGRAYDHAFLDSLPADIDPCGENGEFHTFCTQAPCFTTPIRVAVGAVTEHAGFAHCALSAAVR